MSIENLARLPARVVETLCLWVCRACERRALKDLDDHLLRDLGLSRERAHLEGDRPFWSGAEREHIRGWNQPRFTAFSEKESAKRGSPSGRRKSPVLSAGSILGKSR